MMIVIQFSNKEFNKVSKTKQKKIEFKIVEILRKICSRKISQQMAILKKIPIEEFNFEIEFEIDFFVFFCQFC